MKKFIERNIVGVIFGVWISIIINGAYDNRVTKRIQSLEKKVQELEKRVYPVIVY